MTLRSSLLIARKCLPRFAVFAALAATSVAVAQAQSAGAPLALTTMAGLAGTRQATNGTGSEARLYAPTGIVITASGDLIVADTGNHIFRRVTPAGVVTYYAGRPRDLEDRPINIGSTDGPAQDAKFYLANYAEEGPWAPPLYITVGSFTLAADSGGNIYIADTVNNLVRRLGANGVVSTVAGAGAGQLGSSDGSGTNAKFNSPGGVAIDSGGNLFVTDSGNNTIRRITPAAAVTTFAGVAGTFGGTDGSGTVARFSNPSGIVADGSGNLYVTDTGNHTVRRITPAGVVSTFAGSAGLAGSSDGSRNLARFRSPAGIAIDNAGYLYVADTGNHTIRRITTAGAVTTIAGAVGATGSANGTGTAARLNEPAGVAVDSGGTVYIADTMNNTIRLGTPVTGSGAPTLDVQSQPQRLQVTVGSTATFRVRATGSPTPTYQWLRNGEPIGGANGETYSRPNVAFADAGLYSVIVTSGTISFSSAAAQLQVFPQGTSIPPIVILAQPTDREVTAGQPVTFTVEVSGVSSPTYQWRKDGNVIAGANAASYTIGSVQTGDAGVYTVTITDGGNTASTAGSTLTVLAASNNSAPAITTQPASQSVSVGGTVSFSVVATGTPAPIFQWRKNGTPIGNGGTGSGSAVSGATTATLTLSSITEADAGNYTVTLSNAVGSATSSPAALTVTAPPPSSRIINLSILTPLSVSGEDFTMGYVVGGNATSGAKPLVIRAAGPSLAALGVANTLADPKFELFAGSTKTSENDNWGGSATLAGAMASVGAFAYVGPTSLDAAAAVSITTRDNSVKVSSANAGTGLVIAEVYDATPEASNTTSTPRLINVSVLKNIGSGLTAGFVIRGATNKTVLIRAIGPTLGGFGVGNTNSDPQLTLFRGQTAIGTNNNWGGTAELTAAFTQVGAFTLPGSSLDAALLATLPPADYTVQVTGVNGAIGVALVEVYEVP
ncbi:MAG: immunoglobulin domain-containing protein [Opitutaceae bacterium]|nr:immunoglobulin domain-containing protein [Opitutaceae bacterium]